MILQNMSWGRVMASNDIRTQTDRKYLKKYVTTRGAKVAQFNLKMKFKLSTWVLSFAIKTRRHWQKRGGCSELCWNFTSPEVSLPPEPSWSSVRIFKEPCVSLRTSVFSLQSDMKLTSSWQFSHLWPNNQMKPNGLFLI